MSPVSQAFLQISVGEGAVLVELARDRDDLLARELARGLDQLLLLVGELEIGHAAL